MPDLVPALPFSAAALQREWLENQSHQERLKPQEVVDRLFAALTAPTPLHDLLGLQPYQWLKKRRLEQFHPSLNLFVWRRALEVVHPAHAARIDSLWQRQYALRYQDGERRLQRITGHLSLFVLLTDDFAQQGFMSVAHHVVSRVLGDVQQKPHLLFAVVQLADHLDSLFDGHVTRFGNMEIAHPVANLRD
ncbi:MAG: hypothetical protein H7836_00080 [Magnetococcus sp. YQC-3]